ncbi:hypothetical protein EVAR_60449_1 [Eumeta japonica]|uniref:Uncharacterized protein n=1 Tax=Eumeta variegata TaxID=151549 RepID=A0A4C1YWI8_EUMVA|nr:hypothetical protein EVAR_60449_1 [Eumeta japonica]
MRCQHTRALSGRVVELGTFQGDFFLVGFSTHASVRMCAITYLPKELIIEIVVSDKNSSERKRVNVRYTSPSAMISTTMRPLKPPPPRSGGRRSLPRVLQCYKVTGMFMRTQLTTRGFRGSDLLTLQAKIFKSDDIADAIEYDELSKVA